ncbi:anti-sigma factor [soil metagenome]
MTEHDDERPIDVVAGEYVLGLLSNAERDDVERHARTDEPLGRAIAGWQDRLAALAESAPPLAASPVLWERIERSTSIPAARRATASGDWWSSLAFWRTGSVVAFALAAAFAIALFRPAAPLQRTVAVLSSSDNTAGWIVESDGHGRVRLSPLVQTRVPDDRSLQFWTKAPTASGPTSLGLVPPDRSTAVELAQLQEPVPGQLFELTLEPPGGSTIGRPTGPILFVGRAVALR